MTRRWTTAVRIAAATVLLASCATAPQPQKHAIQKQATAKPPAQKQAALPQVDRQLEIQAAAFDSFMRRAKTVGPTFSGPAAVSQGLQTGAAYNAEQFGNGMVAYAALAALQEPAFVAAMSKTAKDKTAARALVARIAGRPDLAMQLPKADAAAARAGAALQRQATALNQSGAAAKKAAYDVQRQPWSKASVSNAKTRLAEVKKISAAPYRPTADDTTALYKALAEGGKPAPAGPQASPVVARGVTLAALTLLGEPAKARASMSEPKGRFCLTMAKLNLYQCLASAGPYYEDMFCLGQHALIETSQCVAEAARPPRRTASTAKPAV